MTSAAWYLAPILGAALLPPCLYEWAPLTWLLFLLHCFAVAGTGAAYLRWNLGASFGITGVALSLTAASGFYALIFGALRWCGTGSTAAFAIAAIAGQLLTVLMLRRSWSGDSEAAARWQGKELLVLAAACAGVALFIRGPFVAFGADHGDSIGFSSLMVTDIFGHIAAAGEIAKGVPPENPYYSGERLHYYWLSHVLPGSFHELSGKRHSLPQLLQMTCAYYAFLLLVLLAAALRSSLGAFTAWVPPFLATVFAYSFIWLLGLAPSLCRLFSSIFPSLPCSRLFVEQGESYSGLSHGMLRDFVIEPHGNFALCLLLSLLVWRRLAPHQGAAPDRSLFEGLLLGICFGSDSFLGIVATLWWGALRALDVLCSASEDLRRGWLNVFKVEAAIGLGVFLVLSFCFATEMVILQKGNLEVVPYTKMLVLFPFVFLLEFGPIWILALLGAPVLFRKASRSRHRDILILLAVVVPLMFLLRHSYVHNLVFRKCLRVVKIPMLIGMGYATAKIFEGVAAKSRMKILFAILIAAALPSLASDFRGLTESDGSGHSILADKRDVKAYSWLRDHTPERAVIQGRPDYGNKSNYSPAVLFSERRSAAGDFIHSRNYQVGDDEASARSIEIREKLFGANSIEDARSTIRRLGITHIYVGEVERSYYGADVDKFRGDPSHFRQIYAEDGIAIYEVLSDAARGQEK